MKLHILSDLHLGCRPLAAPPVLGDALVLAGDITDGDAGRLYAFAHTYRQANRPVLFVPGNHEFYGHNLARELLDLSRGCRRHGITLLHNRAVVIDGVRFAGSTLWTDFSLRRSSQKMDHVLLMAQFGMADFSAIRLGERRLKPLDTARFHRKAIAAFERIFATPHAGPTVLLAHHGVHPNSVHARFAGHDLNGAFVTNLHRQLRRWKPTLVVHGHVHNAFDYRLGDTRVVTNPRGYFGRRQTSTGIIDIPETPEFDPNLVIEI